MKKYLLFICLTAFSLFGFAWDQRAPLPVQSCQVHAPYGFPQSSKPSQPICREAYLSVYDPAAKIPVYVSYTLLPQNALGCFPRTNAFVADASIQGGPRPDDYAGTGYDKGHAAPDGDLSWSQIVEYESFLMTNMYPQHGSLNRGIWKLLETSVRGWAVQQNQAFTIIVGAVYNAATDKKIGNGVVVPTGFYKVVINNNTGAFAAWAFPHVAPYGNLGNDLPKFRVPFTQLQQQAGIRFPLPANARELAPGTEWPVDYGALTNAKRAKCGRAD